MNIIAPPSTVFRVNGLDQLFAQSVVALKFMRRHQKRFWTPTRGILCTNSFPILNSILGKNVLHFKPPTHPPRYNAAAKNLITAWDIFKQDYRNINLEFYTIQSVIPVRNKEEIDFFWQYFTDVFHPMSASDKNRYMRAQL